MKLGIAGVGVVGGALRSWLSEFTGHELALKDPARGFIDSFDGCHAVFVCVPADTRQDSREVSLSNIMDVLEVVQKECLPLMPVFIKCTVPPGTCDHLSALYKRPIYSMPEFLTERVAYADFKGQPILTGAGTEHESFLKAIFPNKEILIVKNKEAELAKYAHNTFGALKVTFFNIVYEICLRKRLDYENVRNGVLLSGLIEPQHTRVPGPDGSKGYGGRCFPKDVSAFIGYIHSLGMEAFMLQEMEELNASFRK